MARWSSLALLLLLPAPARAADALDVAVLGAAGADLATTAWAFRAVPGVRDMNPMIRGPGSAAAVKLGATAGVLLLDREFKRRGHRRASKVLRVAAVVAWGTAAAWNVAQMRRR
jgi:hypothetical protein